MARYRNNSYRRHSYHRRHQGDYVFDLIKGVFLIGVAFILLGSISSIISGNYIRVVGSVFVWAISLGVIVLIILKTKEELKGMRFSLNRGDTASAIDFSDKTLEEISINSQKHGCKCYMEGLTEGEQNIAHTLAEQLDYKNYFIFNNITIPSSYIGSSQIDHLIISKFGIFVVESKDFNGYIFGSKDQDLWTVSLPGGHVKKSFQNPIRQNWSHVMALKNLFPTIPEQDFHGLVVFSDRSEIKCDPPIQDVGNTGYMIARIKAHTEMRLSEESQQLVIGRLSYLCQTADISPEQHIENLRMRHPFD